MAYVSINEVTAAAQTVLKASDNMDRNIWKYWAYLAALDLGLSDDEIKVAELTPTNLEAALPEGCRQIIEVSLYDTSDNPLKHKFRTGTDRIYPNDLQNVFTTGDSEVLERIYPVDVSNDNNYIYLGTNGDLVGKIFIRYFAYPVDADGQPMIREEDVLACVYFIRYMDALRQDDNRSKIQQDQLNWFREADRARARKKMSSMTPDKARSIMNSLMKVVPAFTSIQNY
jgi:hypothetical protein